MPVALSLRQPWAALVVAGHKAIEVRSWPTAFRGRFLVHAARLPDDRPEAWAWVPDDLRPLTELTGGILGAATLIDCVAYRTAAAFEREAGRHLNDPAWFKSPVTFGFVLTAAERLPFRRLPGNVRFFEVEESPE